MPKKCTMKIYSQQTENIQEKVEKKKRLQKATVQDELQKDLYTGVIMFELHNSIEWNIQKLLT